MSLRPPPPPGCVFVIHGPVTSADVAGLCGRLRLLLDECGADVVVCDVRELAADLVALDALARLQLTARRCGTRLRLERVSGEVEQLLAFAGLADLLAVGSRLRCGCGQES